MGTFCTCFALAQVIVALNSASWSPQRCPLCNISELCLSDKISSERMYSDMREEHTCTEARSSVKPELPETIYHKEEKSFLPSVNTSAFIHCGISRTHSVVPGN